MEKPAKKCCLGCDILDKESFPVPRTEPVVNCVLKVWSQYFKRKIGESSEKSNK